jgi:hypothetical protein
MTLLEDTRQQENKHDFKLQYFEEQNIKVDRCGLYVGDYTIANNQSVCVDTKKDLIEICNNVCKDHERFRKEMVRAMDAEIKLYILCENGNGIKDIEDVKNWVNPRLKRNPKAMTGEQLYKIMKTQEEKYGVKYLFCDKEETGKLILELLGVKGVA